MFGARFDRIGCPLSLRLTVPLGLAVPLVHGLTVKTVSLAVCAVPGVYPSVCTALVRVSGS